MELRGGAPNWEFKPGQNEHSTNKLDILNFTPNRGWSYHKIDNTIETVIDIILCIMSFIH